MSVQPISERLEEPKSFWERSEDGAHGETLIAPQANGFVATSTALVISVVLIIGGAVGILVAQHFSNGGGVSG